MDRHKRFVAIAVSVAMIFTIVGPGMASAVGSSDVGVTGVAMPDMYEDADDTTTTAPALPESSFHTFDTDGDVDWSKFTVTEADTPVILNTVRAFGAGQGDATMYVYFGEANGDMTEVTYDDDYETNWGTYDELVYFTAKEPGTYYVQMTTDNPMTYMLHRSYGIARRIAGANRYATSAAVSQLMRPETDHAWWGTGYSPDAIVVASGENFPDALAGVVLASYHESVLLLTKSGMLPAETKAEIERLGMSAYWNYDDFEVIILGGESAISEAVEEEIASLVPVTHVTRIAGDNRHETAAMIAAEEDDYYGLGTTAFIVNGRNFPDALAAGPVAAYAGGTILTTERDTLPADTADEIVDLGITDCILVGGPSVITSDVAEAIEDLPGSPTVSRLAGADRYETAYVVAQYGVDTYGMNGVASNVDYGAWDGQSMVLVSGANFPDALSAGVMCWYMGSPMLLTHPAYLSDDVMEFLDTNGPTEEPCYVVGGESALSPTAFGEFNDYWENWLP